MYGPLCQIAVLSALCIAASISALSTESSYVEEISNIAPCEADYTEAVRPSQAMRDALSSFADNERRRLIQLEREVDEAKEQINSTSVTIQHWISTLGARNRDELVRFVMTTLQIPHLHHSNLSAEENSRLHVLLQVSLFAHYLKKQEIDVVAYGGNIRAEFKNLRLKLLKVACSVLELLQITTERIRTYARQNVEGHVMIVEGEKPAVRRAVTSAVIRVMLHVFSRIEVLVEAGSVEVSGSV